MNTVFFLKYIPFNSKNYHKKLVQTDSDMRKTPLNVDYINILNTRVITNMYSNRWNCEKFVIQNQFLFQLKVTYKNMDNMKYMDVEQKGHISKSLSFTIE